MPADLNAQTAPFSPYQNTAFNDIAGQTGAAQGIGSAGTSTLQNLLATNPQLASLFQTNPTLARIASSGGGLPTENQTLNDLGLGNTTGMLNATIGGQYLNPATNPYLTATYNEAAKGVTDQYQTATAPSLMAEGEIASGGGPGALANSSAFNQTQWQNQYGLGQNLQNLATNIYGGNYEQERQNQLNAASQAQGLAGQANQLAETGVGNQITAAQDQFGNRLAATEAQQQQQESGLGLLPQTQSSLYQPANQLLQAGSLQQQQQQNVLDTLFQNALRSAEWPQQMFGNFGNLLSQLGGNTGTTITSTPNDAAQK